ncbi:Hypothetical protein FKW44_012827 [Caligus rogercresseyi]|uniref:Uncharacterized protein n=1 Tax=Caligus rogercresseyi TaxID=217165 RepID=A0A7T8HJX2_CALRO|nr:Hypothetical protein FKW44_012827 [Caligus rogercresseyi]
MRTADLLHRAGIPTIIEIVVRQSGMAAWKTVNLPYYSLSDMICTSDSRTRSGTSDLKCPYSVGCASAVNMAKTWNSSPELRQATTLLEARRAATRLARISRHL